MTDRGKRKISRAVEARDPAEALPLTHVAFHILVALAMSNRHGYGIIKHVAESSGGEMVLEAGTLYAAIKRMKDDGWIEVVPSEKGADSRRRTYAIRAFGREVLSAEVRRLQAMVGLARDAELHEPSRR